MKTIYARVNSSTSPQKYGFMLIKRFSKRFEEFRNEQLEIKWDAGQIARRYYDSKRAKWQRRIIEREI